MKHFNKKKAFMETLLMQERFFYEVSKRRLCEGVETQKTWNLSPFVVY
jgi:hypothetical protein